MRIIILILSITICALGFVFYCACDYNKAIENDLINYRRQLENCCLGTWIDSQTGLGYSGPRKHLKDIPANPETGKVCY